MSGPLLGVDAPPSNVNGRTTSITLFTVQRWWGRFAMPVMFFLTRKFPRMLGDMDTLSFISYGSWTLYKHIPYNGPPQRLHKLRLHHMLFEVHFNGSWDIYVDASVRILTRGMNFFWSSSLGFPKPLPGHGFKAFFREHEVNTSHYYCAYPEATVTMTRSALALEPKLDALTSKAKDLDPEQFGASWAKFLQDAQHLV